LFLAIYLIFINNPKDDDEIDDNYVVEEEEKEIELLKKPEFYEEKFNILL
jgi:hypothetical protein